MLNAHQNAFEDTFKQQTQGVYFYKCEQISRFNAVARQALQRKLATQSAGTEIEFSELATVNEICSLHFCNADLKIGKCRKGIY